MTVNDIWEILLKVLWQRSSKVFLIAKKEGPMFGTYKSHYVKVTYQLTVHLKLIINTSLKMILNVSKSYVKKAIDNYLFT